jgi:hypothetical protein
MKIDSVKIEELATLFLEKERSCIKIAEEQTSPTERILWLGKSQAYDNARYLVLQLILVDSKSELSKRLF